MEAAGSAKRDLYTKPTASLEEAQLWVDMDIPKRFREAGLIEYSLQ